MALDSGPWELAVNDPRRLDTGGGVPGAVDANDPSRLDTGPLRDLGGRWVLVNERGEMQALVDSPDPHDSCGMCYNKQIRRGG